MKAYKYNKDTNELDSGVITPQAIKDKRQEAREAIKDI